MKGLTAIVLLGFCALSVLMTAPLVLHIDTAVKNLGDPLLNTWIIWHGCGKILHLDFDFFETNAFYPYTRTLAFSEHMFASALLASPLAALGVKPIALQNILFILSFALSGFTMYLLAHYLAKSRMGAVMAGIVFGFCHYRYGHLGHLQLLTAQWIPVSFLFLHKFFDTFSVRHAALFAVFFALNALSCGYYALFGGCAVGMLLVWKLIEERERLTSETVVKLFAALALCFLIIIPFFIPYVQARHEHGFMRDIGSVENYSAGLKNYLAAPPGNVLLGDITGKFRKGEGELCLGFIAILLAVAGVLRLRNRPEKSGVTRWRRAALYVLAGLSALWAAVIVVMILHGGFDLTVLGVSVRARSLKNPLAWLCACLTAVWVLSLDRKSLGSKALGLRWLNISGTQWLYFFIGIFALICSLGPKAGLYSVLYHVVPGFDGLRVPSRFAVIVMVSVSVFAAYGTKNILECVKGSAVKAVFFSCGAILLVAEYWCAPLGFQYVSPEVPEVYLWLSKQPGDFAIVELPIGSTPSSSVADARPMYWSTFHRKKLMNGYSGFFPGQYWKDAEALQGFPSDGSLAVLKRNKIKYAIVHLDRFPVEAQGAVFRDATQNPVLRLVTVFHGTHVFELCD